MEGLLGINLVLENCEDIYIDKENIVDFHIGNVSVRSSKILYKYLVVDDIWIKFKDIEYKEYNSFGKTELILKRLRKYNDVTQIEFKYKDSFSLKFHVAWDGNDYENSLQKVTKGHDGFWRLRVKEKVK